ncbi:winged helix DNA-binding domain-containing protein [Virgisporangium ochraceum]|uniref:Winged helix DNA-binding domain-containing protein n=1 Tax=Virgisporangium ochraceum TaxID=65505 RepID=A0A8J4EBZ3_9ACTN|nr:winged helix DNA-binding domain-containing protein [Virgisporangium ochraceum]GIJ69114.1 hypothetical protein Voc01_040310 [Virgisporangium ochraceum]
MRRITTAQRRARLARRHRLAGGAGASTVEDATGSLVALHATDPATVFLSLRARVPGVTVAGVERALYEDRSLVRMMAMRRTLFVVPVASVPVVQAAAGRAVAATQRRRYLSLMDGGVMTDVAGDAPTDRAAWLADVEAETLRTLVARGEAVGAELARDVPRLGASVELAQGRSYAATQRITSWVLNLMALDGRIVRTRPRGSWISQQWRWAPTDAWLGTAIADVPVEEARAELVRRWLAAFGPAPVTDIKWWTGWPLGQVRAALAAIGPEEVDLDGTPGVLLPGDTDDEAPEPWVALLPGLDPTPMGWQERSWFLGPHAAALFDRNGNVGPTVWCDGRIVGGWAQRGDGEVVTRLLEDVGAEAAAAVEAAAAGVAAWVGPTRVTPRFRTPLEKELTA